LNLYPKFIAIKRTDTFDIVQIAKFIKICIVTSADFEA